MGGASGERQAESGGWVEPVANAEITAFDARRALTIGFAVIFYKIHGAVWRRRPKAMRRHPNRVLPLDPGHRITRPPWPEADLFYIQ